MFSSNCCKIFFLCTLAFCSSCRFWQTPTNSNVSTNQANVAEIKSEIPFPTKEAETFQAEIIIKNDGEEEKYFLARSKGKFFLKTGEKGNLTIDANKSYLLDFSQKFYVENSVNSQAKIQSESETLQDFLTTEWLNQQADVNYENLGVENGLTKYRVAFEASESLIFVDDNYKIPVKQEFYSVEGEQKRLLYSMELQNIKLVVDESLFEVPKDFRKVSSEEFNQSLEKK